MRLLKLNDNGELSLVEQSGHNVLEYAILSHAWGPDGEEVTYEDLMMGTGGRKPGYDKIRFCGKQAKADGLQYFWIDTCCINKANFTELSQAINSMFRWYSEAARCYVYLSDVPDPHDHSSTVESAFLNSRWFKRGWTLQELIAPSSVQFFSREGDLLGSKKSRELQIHQITGITAEALQGAPLSQISTAERLSWAAQRQTTVEEDAAYCLLGIFDIQMPLIYGEGRQKALDRLQRKIKKALGVPVVPEYGAWIVPFERNSGFIGRGPQLAQLEGMLFSKNHTSKIAIIGLGGVGKTQLVLELLFLTKDKHPECSIIWIPATNKESLHQAYLNTVQQLRIPGWEDSKDVKKLMQEHLSKENTGRWLLVFDNADDINMWVAKTEPGLQPLIDYLPKSRQGTILFTTRDRRLAVKLAQQNVVEIPEMEEDVAARLLEKCLIDPRLINNRHDTSALLSQLTYLPLAIVQAAAYINENGIEIADYLSLLEDQEEEVINLLSEEFEDYGRYHDVKNPVATTWLLSFEQIRQRDPLAAEYLSFMACVDPKGIPQSLLPPGPTRKKEIDAIGTLNAYSFIVRRPLDKTLDLHRLVHLTLRNWLRKEEQLRQLTEKAIMRLEKMLLDYDHIDRSTWRIYLPHARYALESDLVDNDWGNKVHLMWSYGVCLYNEGRWAEAEASFSQVIKARTRIFGKEHPETLASMANLASTQSNQGRWHEAEELEIEVTEISKRALGLEHPLTIASIANLASTYGRQGRWDEAEALKVQAMETCKTVLGAGHPYTLISMGNLASTYKKQGRWDEAEALEVQAMETCKTVLGAEHPHTLTIMGNLAVTLGDQGRWREAEALEVPLMETHLRILGAEHPDTLTSMGNLASTFAKQYRWSEAKELDMQVVEARKKVLGAEHPDTLGSMNSLALTFGGQGRWDKSESLLIQVTEASKRVLGAEHPNTLTWMINLAWTYKNQNQLDKAEELGMRVMEACETVLGAEHPDTLLSMNNLALTFSDQGRWDKSKDLQIRVIEAGKRMLGAEHPNTLTSMANLALTFERQDRWKEAEGLWMQVMETRKRVLGVEHLDTLASMNRLGLMFWDQGRWKEAEELQLQVKETRKSLLGIEHPDTLTTMAYLASTYWNQGRWKEAEDLQMQLTETRKRVLGAEHPDTLNSMANLATMLRNQEWEAVSDGGSQGETGSGLSRHADQHGQSGGDVS